MGRRRAWRLVEELERSGSLGTYHLLPATRADLLRRLGRYEEAAAATARRWNWPAPMPSDASWLAGWRKRPRAGRSAEARSNVRGPRPAPDGRWRPQVCVPAGSPLKLGKCRAR